MIYREPIRKGDRLKMHIKDVKRVDHGPQIFLSRTSPDLLKKLFSSEVPEISNGTIEIRGVAREPGMKAKVAVYSFDNRVDPVGSCIGVRGSRVQTITNELNGEHIDIVRWSEDPATYVINALSPAEVSSIIVDENLHVMDVTVGPDHLAQAIGKAGQNVKLVSQLTGWGINVLSESEAQEKRASEDSTYIAHFVEMLGVDEEVAIILVEEGFTSIEEVAYVPLPELLAIEAFDKDVVTTLRNRATDRLLNQAISIQEKIATSEPSDELLGLHGMTESLAHLLASKDVKTVDSLADLSTFELLELASIPENMAKSLILEARKAWFDWVL